jgi:L-ribulose-5-phosphate 3-epimerase UlaE
LPHENDIMSEIDKEAEKINDIMDQKIKIHPGLGDIYSYCYDSVEELLQCQNEIVEEMEPHYEDAGKRITDKIESSDP